MTIVCAFPATGKSYAALESWDTVVDLESSEFSWSEPGVRSSEWPANYVRQVVASDTEGWLVLVSSHQEVRDALVAASRPFVLVYPERGLHADYLERMRRRGSPTTLIDFVRANWDELLDSCERQEGCAHVVLRSGQYLSDVLPWVES